MIKRRPIFENVLKVLRREVPSRPVLMELFMNDEIYTKFSDPKFIEGKNENIAYMLKIASAYSNLGYDYFTVYPSKFGFARKERVSKPAAHTTSLNSESYIYDRKSFDEYIWREPEDFSMAHLAEVEPYVPDGMKAVMVSTHGGVLENIIGIMGYDNLCTLIYEDPQLVSDVAENVGKRLVRLYEMAAEYDLIGAAFGNDDWGFNTHTVMSPKHMREYIFPWHKKIVEAMHSRGKPCILHSCGNLSRVMDDVIDDIKYDGRHSYEDNIKPVEDFYEEYHDRIAIIGGMDIDFITTKTPEEIKARAKKMLERVSTRGGYALGTGNSVPWYIPHENFLAMLSAAYEFDT